MGRGGNGLEIICRDTGMTESPGTQDTTDVVSGSPEGLPEQEPPVEELLEDEGELSEGEIEAFRREQVFASSDEATPDEFPRMYNLSAGFMYRAVIRAEVPARPEYVTVPMPEACGDESLSTLIAVSRWNLLWEAAQFRRRFFNEGDLPPQLARIADGGDVNVVFVPRSTMRYHEYAPLYHLLPRATLERFGLPLLSAGQWPFVTQVDDIDRYIQADFEQRLSRAWASQIWRHLMPGSPIGAFTTREPIRLLAHNLDFWVPPVTEVMQDALRGLPVVDNGIDEGPVPLIDGSVLPGAVTANPRMGSDLWRGEEDAAKALARTVDAADATGRLRGILDAVRSHRVEDDFSDRWSYAKEDFERKLYNKRNKVRVRFVEITDTIPVQGPETEVEDALVYADFLALLDERDRQVVVLLNSGTTKLTDVANILGYANHSAVSKRLKRIRQQAKRFFDVG